MTTTSDDDAQDAREWLTSLLPEGAHRHIDTIVDFFGAMTAHEVEVVGGRVPLERVSAYGLDIRLDANGAAAAIRFPYGAEVTEWWW
jgi:hypothetical protein